MSQADPHKISIDGHEFVMHMLPPMVSHDLLIEVVQMVGPGMGPVLDALGSNVKGKQVTDLLSEDLTSDFFSRASEALFKGLRRDVIERVIRAFRSVTRVDNQLLDGTFDIFFLGRLDLLYRWLGWGMGVQWGKAFRALLGGIGKQGAVLTEKVFQSPNTSNG